MHGEGAPHHIFIDIGSKRFIYQLRYPWAAKLWVALFYCDNHLDESG